MACNIETFKMTKNQIKKWCNDGCSVSCETFLAEKYERTEEYKKNRLEATKCLKEVRKCDVCGAYMMEGFYDNGSNYCSKGCLHKHHTDDEWKELYNSDSDSYYWAKYDGEFREEIEIELYELIEEYNSKIKKIKK